MPSGAREPLKRTSKKKGIFMAWDNNPGDRQEGLADVCEMINKAGDSLSLGKERKPLWLDMRKESL